jgi:ubiquinone/menaquinone biosynthesis C-methylase UbiE
MRKQAVYWETVVRDWQEDHPQALWRVHSDAVYGALLERWLPNGQVDHVLKTDLFDEAVGDGLYRVLASRSRAVIAVDVSHLAAHAARARHTALRGLAADCRCLPFADSTFDVIVSNSTLDHFESFNELRVSLRELYRVLQTGGQMLLTLDNLSNPMIALRNSLPWWLLSRLHVVPYYVGATCGPRRLQRVLGHIGFEVLEVDAIMHQPSVLAVASARRLQRRAAPETQKRFLALLMALERLSRWPTRFLTGHYVAVRARKP